MEKIDQINEAKLFLQLTDMDGDQHVKICFSTDFCHFTHLLCSTLWCKQKHVMAIYGSFENRPHVCFDFVAQILQLCMHSNVIKTMRHMVSECNSNIISLGLFAQILASTSSGGRYLSL